MGQKSKELEPGVRKSILKMSKAGMSIRVISDILKIPRSTIHDTLQRDKKYGTVLSRPRTGRPSTVTYAWT